MTDLKEMPPHSSRDRQVSVIVLTWNGLEYTKPCLDSVLAHTDTQLTEIVVVDNGSTDGTVEYLKQLPGIATVFNNANLGFVKGNNAALKLIAPDRDVILLNNDTEIDDPLWIEKLQRTAYSGDDVGVVGCRIKRLDGEDFQHAGTYIPDRTYWGQQFGSGEKDINQYPYDRDVEGVVFACVYIRRELMDKIGFLDEDFFSYYEDSDYCLKARQAGYRVVNCGSLTVRHREHGSTSANKVSHSEMFLKSQETFLRKWKQTLDARYPYKLHLHSTFFNPVGYAMTARQIALGLDAHGVSVSYEYLYGEGTVYPVDEPRDRSTGVYALEVIKQRREPDASVPRLIYGQADAFSTVKTDSYRIGYTMLETTGVPKEWVDGCNKLDELWVPTPFNEWTFRRSGVKVPITIMPLGLVDTNYFNPEIKGAPIPEVFTFLSIFEWGERKSPETLLRAFNRAFRATDPVVLICKYSNRDPGVNPSAIVAGLGLDPEGGRIIYSENESTPYYQVAQLYRSADCFVLPTRGEGWGMPILEAMACGTPAIASYWSAQQAFLDEDNSYPLQVSLTPAEAKCPYYLGFEWALPDEQHLVNLLRHVYANQEEAAAKGKQAAQDVAQYWSLDKSTDRMAARVAELQGDTSRVKRRSRPRKRIGIDCSRAIGSEVSGVGGYAATLVKGLSQWQAEHGRDFDFLLFPGFGSFTHPAYRPEGGSPFQVARGTGMTTYRGPLPAFGHADTYVPGLDLVYCTANAFPRTIDGPSLMVVHDTTFLSHPQFHTRENIDLCESNFKHAIDADSHFVAVSENSRNDLIRHYGVQPDRVVTIHNGIDGSVFRPASEVFQHSVRQRYELPEKYFLFVGSLEPRKNLKTLLRAVQEWHGEEALVVVGASGWLNDELRKSMASAGSRVKVLGYVPRADLPSLYAMATAFVYPSLYEGFGLPVVEAMACATPVITSNNSSLGEIASDAALLLQDPLDATEMGNALRRLSEDAALRSSLRAAGLARASRFSLQEQVRKHVELFARLVGGAQ
ncbi:glycosyltransferase [Stenotrophomonas sp. HITSZ_GD]|uniref:glycosyltransferase n=1 Tax=Stenotrophomonas sp. HITSZ_GD TaxID=3037248 RepID=UPI00240D44D3|nr:glycosyltransferase [Stenotrophomonas sp. HITSZ_GD]MDG2525639.1 glycosyltransferase [Stenotrophomonas sp. HITSZ_GD]